MVNAGFEIEFNKPYNYVITRFKGNLNYDLLLIAYDQVVNSTQYQSGMGRIWDLTNATLTELNQEELWMASQYPTVFPLPVRLARAAIVTENPDNHELIQIFKTYSEDIQGPIKLFFSLQSAINWISEKP